jgi:hypothetical protein
VAEGGSHREWGGAGEELGTTRQSSASVDGRVAQRFGSGNGSGRC